MSMFVDIYRGPEEEGSDEGKGEGGRRLVPRDCSRSALFFESLRDDSKSEGCWSLRNLTDCAEDYHSRSCGRDERGGRDLEDELAIRVGFSSLSSFPSFLIRRARLGFFRSCSSLTAFLVIELDEILLQSRNLIGMEPGDR